MAEQNILGLSIFFTAYLYVGSLWSHVIMIDDPFQNLDDVNLLSFVRMFDDVAAACGAEQLVIALHQRALSEYLKSQFAGPPITEQEPETPGFVLLKAFQCSDEESSVEQQPCLYRDPTLLACCKEKACAASNDEA